MSLFCRLDITTVEQCALRSGTFDLVVQSPFLNGAINWSVSIAELDNYFVFVKFTVYDDLNHSAWFEASPPKFLVLNQLVARFINHLCCGPRLLITIDYGVRVIAIMTIFRNYATTVLIANCNL